MKFFKIKTSSKNEIPKLKRKLTKAFNQFIRLRDAGKGCISCVTGPVEHAGHYWSTSQCPQPSMRFNEANCHGQCISCNSFKEGNRQGYEKGLIKRYGPKIIKELDIKRSFKQNPWTRWEFEFLIKHYEKKVKEFNGHS